MAKDWFEALGAKAPAPAPATEVTPAPTPATEVTPAPTPAPAAEPASKEAPSENAAAEVDSTLEQQPEEGEQPPTSPESDTADAPPAANDTLTKEQRADNARRRREEENRLLEQRVRQEERSTSRQQMDSFVSALGLTDFEGKPVTSWEDFRKYSLDREREIVNTELERAGLDSSVIDKAISSHPAVQEARRAAEAGRAAEQRGQNAAAEARMKEQLTEIQKLDPTIKTSADLRAHPSYDKVYGFVKSGLSMAEAFTAANIDTIRQRDRQAAAQRALNDANGKNHLVPATSHGDLPETVPETVKKSFRDLYGEKLSEDEILKKYKRLQKQN